MKKFDIKFINLYTILRDIFYNWWVIVFAGIIGFSCGQIYYSYFLVPQYTSTMTIAVNLTKYTASNTASALTKTIDLAETYQNVLQSQTIVEIVENKLGYEITGTVSAVQRKETNLIDISVTDTSPDRAYRLLTEIYNNYPVLTNEQFSNVVVSVIKNPTMPNARSNFYVSIRKSFQYGIFSALICIVLIAVISFFRDTVKNISDVENLLDTKLFGIVRHVNKRKSHIGTLHDGLILTNPLITYEFGNSFSEMAVKLESLQRTKHIKVIMLTSVAENEGKTTVSVNLALALAAIGKKVVLVDSDLRRPAVHKFFKKTLGTEYTDSIKLVADCDNFADTLKYDSKTGLYLSCNQKSYNNSAKIVSQDFFKEYLAYLNNNFDFVIVDTPPIGLVADAELVSSLVDAVLFVVRQDAVSSKTINDYLETISDNKLFGCIFNDIYEFSNRKETDTSSTLYTEMRK